MKQEPKILFWDIETTYVRARVWRTGKTYITHDQIIDGDHTKIICIGYKWAHEKKAHCLKWDNKKQDCSKLIKEFSKIIEQADIAIAHNGDKFDVKHLNTQLLLANQPPLDWPTTEDTLKQLRKVFYLPSYRLDYVAKMLFGEGKSPMSFVDWVNILEGKTQKIREAALNKMVKYCIKDVEILHKAWKKVLPYLQVKASRSILKNGNRQGCHSCGSKNLTKNGSVARKSGRFQTYRCKDCGSITTDWKKLPQCGVLGD